MKPVSVHLPWFSHVSRIEISAAEVFDERDINDKIWCARTITFIGADGSRMTVSAHSDERELPVEVIAA